MFGIAATSFDPERLDLLYLNQYSQPVAGETPGYEAQSFSMVHWAFNPLPSDANQSSPSMTSISKENLGPPSPGGTFTTPPVAVSWAPAPGLITGPPKLLLGSEAAPPGSPETASPAVQFHGPGGPGGSPVGPGGTGGENTPQPPGTPQPFRVDVFALDQNHAMRVLEMPNGVPELAPVPGGDPFVDVATFGTLGGNFISSPAAVVNNGQVLLFGIQADRAMYTSGSSRTVYGEMYAGEWTSLGGIFTSAPTAVSGGLGQVDVFARDQNFQLAHQSWDGTNWGPDWENLGGTLASAPVAVSWGPNRIDVFALQPDGSVGHRWWDGKIWNDWQPLNPPAQGIILVGTPSAMTWGQGRLDVFVSGSDGNLYQYTQTAGAFGVPQSLGRPSQPLPAGAVDAFTPSPTAIAQTFNHAVTFGLANQGSDKGPLAGYRIWDGATWRGWAPLDSCGLPSRYRFSVDDVKCQATMATLHDSDMASASITVGNAKIQNVSQSLGDLGSNQQAQTNLLVFEPVEVELCEPAIFSYQVLNSSKFTPDDINTALDSVALTLAQAGLSATSSALASGAASVLEVPVGGLLAPAIGSALKVLAGWVASALGTTLNLSQGACDGEVALEQAVLLGTAIAADTAGGQLHSVTTEHTGVPPSGCNTSQYQVIWSISQV